MYRLLSIEFLKIFKNRISKILVIIYFSLLLLLFLISNIEFELFGIPIRIADQGIFNFPFIWHFNTYVADYFKIFFAVVIVSMMANEYTYGTLKQNLIDGFTKKEVILSKFLSIIVFSFISTLLVFAITLLLGLRFSSYNEPSIIFSQLEYVLGYFIKLTAFFSFCLFLSVLIKRSAFALGFLIFWYIFEFLSHGIIKYVFLKEKEKTDTLVDKIYDFFPFEAMSNVIVEPYTRINFIKTIGTQVGMGDLKDYSVHLSSILIVLGWIFIFIFSSYQLLKRRDL